MPATAVPGLTALEREEALLAWFRQFDSVAIGFSGGVDSSYLAAVAIDALGRRNALAIVGRSDSFPESQWLAARDIAERIGIPVLEVDTNELADERYAANPSNRCYFCKSELWTKLAPAARAHGASLVVDGTNADDLTDFRPGAKAAKEHGVRSPLAEIGMSKAEIRERSRARGLPTWAQPSSPCLSSRIPYGTPVTVERLRRIDRAESALRALGITGNLRVRDHGELARIELDQGLIECARVDPLATQIVDAIRSAGFSRVTIDPAGFRSGSLNVLAGLTRAHDGGVSNVAVELTRDADLPGD